jgi:hypothetical protein
MSREQALKAANFIADDFTFGFCDDQMIELFADRIEEVYGNDNAMSLRDYFAGKAMSGILSHLENHMERFLDLHDEDIAKFSYRQADAMLKARGES